MCGSSRESVADLSVLDLGTDFNVSQIQMMTFHGCALSTLDELKCWGYDVTLN